MMKIEPGRYRHYKGNEYEVLDTATHSETGETLVVYRALYGGFGVWARPASMWNEEVELDGKKFPRFMKLEDDTVRFSRNEGVFASPSGRNVNYLLYKDAGNCAKRPLLVYLHGTDGCGDDITKLDRIESIPFYLNNGSLRPRQSAVILAPQCPNGMRWSDIAGDVLSLIRNVAANNGVDMARISLTGASLGGMGTFSLAIAEPHFFSALAPVCGSVKPALCAALTDTPVWIFHGENDTGMGFSVVEANEVINAAGGSSKLTMLRDFGHEIRWIYVAREFDLVEWMLSSKRG